MNVDNPYILYIAIPVIGSIIAYVFKSFTARLDQLENTMETKISEIAVRNIVNDKVEPLKEQLDRIDDSLNKIVDILMRK